jgi:hypothetical protein
MRCVLAAILAGSVVFILTLSIWTRFDLPHVIFQTAISNGVPRFIALPVTEGGIPALLGAMATANVAYRNREESCSSAGRTIRGILPATICGLALAEITQMIWLKSELDCIALDWLPLNPWIPGIYLISIVFSLIPISPGLIAAALIAYRSPIPPHSCLQCGYDLTGNQSGRCPECGQDIAPE